MQINWYYQSNYAYFRLNFLRIFSTWLIILTLYLTGCTQLPRSQQAVEKTVKSMLSVSDQTNIPDAIRVLLNRSDKQYYQHNLTGALSTLERALRINPRYAEVWSRMAQVYLDQGQLEQAKQHAKRSNSVIKNNVQFKTFNNHIINLPLADVLKNSESHKPVTF